MTKKGVHIIADKSPTSSAECASACDDNFDYASWVYTPQGGLRGFERALHDAGKEITRTVVEKNRAYGDAVSRTADVLAVVFPHGIPVEKYGDVGLIIRVLDKINRIGTGDKAAFDESPWHDIAGYAMIGIAKDEGESDDE